MIEKTVKINENITLVITCIGQCAPAVSDEVQVRGEIRLAVRYGGPYLAEELQFEGRVDLLGESLISTWGTPNDHLVIYRARFHIYTAPTWKKAFDKAEKAIGIEVNKLVTAIATRKAALEAAEL